MPDVFQLKNDQILNNASGLLKGDYWVNGNPREDKSYNPLGRDKHVMDYEQFTPGGNPNDATWVKRWELSYGRTMYKLQSFGPMRDVESWGWAETIQHPGFPDKYYDPSNGTISRGLITRTQAYTK